jgi:hypothetical protein
MSGELRRVGVAHSSLLGALGIPVRLGERSAMIFEGRI